MDSPSPDLLSAIADSVAQCSQQPVSSSPTSKVSKFLAKPSVEEQLAAIDAQFDAIEAQEDDSLPIKPTKSKRKHTRVDSSSSLASEKGDDLLSNSLLTSANTTATSDDVLQPIQSSSADVDSDSRPRKKPRTAIADTSEDEQPVSKSDIASSSNAGRAVQKARLAELAAKRAAARLAKQPARDVDVDVDVDVDMEPPAIFSSEDEAAKKVLKAKKKRKASRKSEQMKSLSKKELAEMHRVADDLRRKKDVYIPVANKGTKKSLASFMATMNKANLIPTITSQIVKVGTASSSVAKPSPNSGLTRPGVNSTKPISSTPMEKHAAMDIDDADSYQPDYLYFQQDSFTSRLPPKVSNMLENDPIETSLIEPSNSSPQIASKSRTNFLEEEDEDLPDADAAVTSHLKNIKIQKEAEARQHMLLKRKQAALQAAQQQVGDESSSSDIEILKEIPIRAETQDPRNAIDNFSKKHHRARSSILPTDTQINRAGQQWAAKPVQEESLRTTHEKASRTAAPALTRDLMNSSLLAKSAVQGLQSSTKRKDDWIARGGRERQVLKANAEETVETGGTKDLIAAFAAQAKDDSQTQEAEEDADDEDWDEGVEAVEDEEMGSGSERPVQDSDDEDPEAADEDASGAEDQAVDDDVDSTVLVDEPSAIDSDEEAKIPLGQQSRTLQRDESRATVITESTLSPTQIIDEVDCPILGKAALKFALPEMGTQDFGFTQAFADEGSVGQDVFAGPQSTQELFKARKQIVNDIVRSQGGFDDDFSQVKGAMPIFAALENPLLLRSGEKPFDFASIVTQNDRFSPEPAPERDFSLQPVQDVAKDDEERSSSSGRARSSSAASATTDQPTRKRLQRLLSETPRGPIQDADDNGVLAEEGSEAAIQSESEGLNLFDQIKAVPQADLKVAKAVKKKPNMFVDDQANESDEDERFGGGLMGTNRRGDGDEEEDSDDDRMLENLVDDEKVDPTMQSEQDKLAAEKFREDEVNDDAKRQKNVEKTTKGGWRSRRTGVDVLSDSDYSDDEYGKSRGRQAYKEKKRQLEGKDEMDSIALNPETCAFAETYKETHEIKGKGETYDFLQAEGSASEGEDEEFEQIKRKARKAQHLEDIIARERARKGEVWDGSSSSPKRLIVHRIKDHTAVAAHAAPVVKTFAQNDFSDLDTEYATHSRIETEHQQRIRHEESQNQGWATSESFSKRAGQSSSVTNMTARCKPVAQRTTSAPTVRSLAKSKTALTSTKSLSSTRQGSFRR